jgi:biotin carboxyl carrier protein
MTSKVEAEVAGTVWKVLATPGTTVEADDPIVILESMKMEIPVFAPRRCQVTAVLVAEGDLVAEGQAIAEIA